MWHPHPHISLGIDACGNCTLNISERIIQQHFVVTDVNAGGGHARVCNRRQLYEDFARSLWHAYKDLFPKATLLLGFDIGFLFKQDAQFENGLTAFLSKYPPLILDVPELLRRQRAKWQQGLSSFRNDYLEHRKKEIAEFAPYYEPNTVEVLFDHAWRTMAELFPAFIEARYPQTWSIMEIPMNERDPKHSRRWRFFQCEPVERGSFMK